MNFGIQEKQSLGLLDTSYTKWQDSMLRVSSKSIQCIYVVFSIWIVIFMYMYIYTCTVYNTHVQYTIHMYSIQYTVIYMY